MEYLALFGVALFLIIVSAVMYFIFGSGPVASGSLILMGVVMTVAVGFGIFMAIASIMPIVAPGINDVIPESSPAPLMSMKSPVDILSMTICDNNTGAPEPCQTAVLQDNNDITLYWQVQNGIGCCATYHCYYPLFEAACIQPEFKLYDIYLDGVKTNWSMVDWSTYNYTCSYFTPWNWHVFRNVAPGQHTILLEQKDCVDIVSTRIMEFNLVEVNSYTYYIEVV